MIQIHDNAALNVVFFIAVLIPSIILHEVAHGWVAKRYGDDTARRLGRLTLNPVSHIDPVGSVLLPTFLALAGQNVFGWAKPVPVNPAAFRRPREHMAIVSLAGPATNLAIAFVVGRLGPFIDVGGAVRITASGLLPRLLGALLVVNASLAVFNMLPIPPLDGSRLVPLILPESARILFDKISQYGFLILFLLLFVFEGSLSFLGDVIAGVVRLVV